MRGWFAIALSLALFGCGAAEMPDQTEGTKVYEANCAACHGSSGKGDGKHAAALAIKPSDLTLIAARNGGRFPVSAVLSKIDGYSADRAAQEAMPEFGEMLSGDLVPIETDDGVMTPTPRPLAALLAYLEIIQQ